jgi:hypothetical protein
MPTPEVVQVVTLIFDPPPFTTLITGSTTKVDPATAPTSLGLASRYWVFAQPISVRWKELDITLFQTPSIKTAAEPTLTLSANNTEIPGTHSVTSDAPSTTAAATPSTTSSPTLHQGAIVGISVPAGVVVLFVTAFLFILMRRRKKAGKALATATDTTRQPSGGNERGYVHGIAELHSNGGNERIHVHGMAELHGSQGHSSPDAGAFAAQELCHGNYSRTTPSIVSYFSENINTRI